MMRSDYYVYTYSYPSGVPFYVGKGCGRRDRVHLCDAKAGRNSDKWAVRVINKLLASSEQPTITRLIENVDNELACFIEEEYIDKYGRRDLGTGILVNCTSGGDAGAPALSPETEARKRVPASEERKRYLSSIFKGTGNPFYGKTHGPEAIKKIVAANIGKTLSEAQKRKQSAAMEGKHRGSANPYYGKKHQKEVSVKMSEAQRRLESDRKAKGLDHFNKGRKHSSETMAKLTIERTCPHCGRIGRGSAMNRYHMNNCKKRVVV